MLNYMSIEHSGEASGSKAPVGVPAAMGQGTPVVLLGGSLDGSANNLVVDLESLALSMSRTENLPVLSSVVTEVLNTIDNPSSSPKMLEGILERDASIAGKILRVANSAAYSSQPIASVGRAVSMLGLNTVRSLVVSIGFQNFSSGRSRSQRFSRVEFWKHSLAVALAARVLARMKAPALAEEAYTAGLMHDMGLLILDRFCPEELDRAIFDSAERGLPIHASLNEVLGYDEAQVSGLMAERFRLSELIRNAIEFHLNPIAADQHQEASMLVSAANTLAHQCGYENQAPGVEMAMDAMAQVFLGIGEDQLGVIKTVIQAEVARNEAAFNLDAAA